MALRHERKVPRQQRPAADEDRPVLRCVARNAYEPPKHRPHRIGKITMRRAGHPEYPLPFQSPPRFPKKDPLMGLPEGNEYRALAMRLHPPPRESGKAASGEEQPCT